MPPTPPRAWVGHPLWLVGFRPFFLLACLAGALLPPVWVLMWSGALAPPPGLAARQWHAHELFFGFGFAVLAGFLLTASKNWVKTRGHFGRALQGLVALWLLERWTVWQYGAGPHAWLFGVAVLVAVEWTLLRGRRHDSYRDNALFFVALSAFLGARWLLLREATFESGVALTLALYRLVFVVMLERTLPPFMQAAFQLELRRVPALDVAIKLLALALVSSPWWPPWARATVELLLAAALTGRFLLWHAVRALRRVEVAVMYLGGFALVGQLVLDALGGAWVGSLPLHLFTVGTMGLIIPAMLTRISLGHTGRPVRFEVPERLALGLMGLAVTARTVLLQCWPAYTIAWLTVAAVGWSACFLIIGARLAPRVWKERVDGREH